jgi:hypothetical protein
MLSPYPLADASWFFAGHIRAGRFAFWHIASSA